MFKFIVALTIVASQISYAKAAATAEAFLSLCGSHRIEERTFCKAYLSGMRDGLLLMASEVIDISGCEASIGSQTADELLKELTHLVDSLDGLGDESPEAAMIFVFASACFHADRERGDQ